MSKKSFNGFFVRPEFNFQFNSSWSDHLKVIAGAAVALAVVISSPVVSSSVQAAEISTNTKLTTSNSECPVVGSIWWNELLAPEPAAIGKFYANVFGWKSKFVGLNELNSTPVSEDDKYTIFMSGDQEVAGMMNETQLDNQTIKSKGWLIYFQVENVRDAVEAAEKAGGTILQRPFEIAGGHQIAIIRDPNQNTFGVVKPAGTDDCKSSIRN